MTFDELCIEYAKIDTFMEPQITLHRGWLVVETMADGIDYIEDEYNVHCDGMYPGYVGSVSYATGHGARLSASGYLDCTDWCVFDTEQQAIDYLAETYLED